MQQYFNISLNSMHCAVGKEVVLEKLVEKKVVDKVSIASNELVQEIATKLIYDKRNKTVSYREL